MAGKTTGRGKAAGAKRQATRSAGGDSQVVFDRVTKKYFEWLTRQYPGFATYVGVHDYDTRMTDYSAKAHSDRKAKFKEFLKEFQAIGVRGLDVESKIERQLAIDNLQAEIQLNRAFCQEERNPGLFLGEGVNACYAITVRECGDAEEAANKMTQRLLGIPKLLGQGRKLISKPTRINCETALLSGQGAIAFFKDTVAKFAKRVKDANTRQQMRDAAQVAEEAVQDYLDWIEQELLATASSEFAVGKDLFDMLLKKHHQLDFDSEELLKLGKRVLKQTLKELEATAERINKNYSWEQLVEILKRDHPTNSELVQYYADEMKRAKRFVIEHRLVDIPEGERIDVVATPEFARPVIPYAAYVPPAPYEKEQRGIFWVTPVDKDRPPEEMEEQLRGHCTHGIVITALHEAYPGHHLQLTIANQLKDRPLRILFHTSVFAEGWALYCEQMMWEQGFYDDLRARILQLKDQLWRVCRVILDVQLHTGGWSFDQAVKFLVEKASIEKPHAEAEVRRYCQTPTQPMSYIVGKEQVLALLADYKEKRGNAFNLRQFHNELLRHGTLPVKQLRLLMELPETQPGDSGKKPDSAARPAPQTRREAEQAAKRSVTMAAVKRSSEGARRRAVADAKAAASAKQSGKSTGKGTVKASPSKAKSAAPKANPASKTTARPTVQKAKPTPVAKPKPAPAKPKPVGKPKASAKPKAAAKPRTTAKPKPAAKTKAAATAKPASKATASAKPKGASKPRKK